ncbi:DUF3618 domain-containing protein [Pseudofrankia inefficax]|uniref:DUF3618 domain-containing protein n=1 Tax=Pseudofrankia inefficax (strain DSM 45817 / CECT 9037 / DDB 130130 / EuI1c) TaxID=298654 RepID=E3IUS5_PSEI1|nr:DUF3618 domain-containing protein [Pseudofrankia inefficax]ADP84891.1 hypothetical protein FraEuI1c_6923 [Pseudofrankia inefficax]
MGARPEEIRSEIEETRDRITAEIDELTARYSPGRVASRKANGARDAATSMRAKVGSGAAGMKQRLALRSSSHHEHSSTCGHLGEGQTGTGQALDVGVSQAAAERRGEAQRRERGGRLRRHRQHEDQPPAPYPADVRRVDSSYDPASGPGSADFRPPRRQAEAGVPSHDPSTYRADDHVTYARVRKHLSSFPRGHHGHGHRQADEQRSDEQRTDQQRSSVAAGGSQQAGGPRPGDRSGRGRKRDLGLAGASIVIGALGARTVRHPGRREKDLLEAANRKRPYASSGPADSEADGGSRAGAMSGLTSAAARAALKRKPASKKATAAKKEHSETAS